ncbi:cysteine--tRNA ligase [Megasphaera vaginalis (ex Bordigoni et al. 2020)]|uniref:cysteine--tRNA ligase n=1 Tax=Megasphaera vaginalis (ex Bordigoni et al. 2020) TaxID=2045301 RepID=UPI000C798176|nr:cysteine--tRNA ligase [Megasphaera vaginalis (ex Bordigoni et al. 2020)]
MRELMVYNTLTRKKEKFVPVTPGQVKMYVCGITPYNHSHMGNARPFVTWDVIKRYLEHLGYEVLHIQNFTDVDDKIINAANGEDVSWDTISNRYIASYFEVMDALHVRRADKYPRVSDHMRDIIRMVETLIEKGHAYVLDHDVYYKVDSFANYGQLSGRTLDDMMAGARIEIDDRKENPMDFALWKGAKPGEPAWDSPWGKGRPGWHIECSAMSNRYLGDTFDFHGGGSDLIFPHHENEIAQSEAFCGHGPMVRYWLHNGFITINSEKMSKSLNNFFLVKDVLAHYSADALRYFLISNHYRSPLDFSDERLEEMTRSLERLGTAIDNTLFLLEQPSGAQSAAGKQLLADAQKAEEDYEAAMCDDFNTALASASMFELAKKINIYKNDVVANGVPVDASVLAEVKRIFKTMTDILGILEARWTGSASSANDEDYAKLMAAILEIRQECRAQKQYALADAIRDKLAALGITIEDSPQGAHWKK